MTQFNQHPEKFSQLGFGGEFKLSTLSEANSHRTSVLYEKMFLSKLSMLKAKHQRAFAFPLEIMDSSSMMSNHIEGEWAAYSSNTSGVKVHVVFDAIADMPVHATITSGKVSDINVAKETAIAPGTFRLEDRAYFDAKRLIRLTNTGVFFAQRMRAKLIFTTLSERKLNVGNVRGEATIQLMGAQSQAYCEHLRRIEIWDEQKNETFFVITNNFELPAETIAAFYKARWRIELFFKWMKQHLKLSRFLGYSHNAVKIQIWTALLTYLLLWELRLLTKKTHQSMLEFVRELRARLFAPAIDYARLHRIKQYLCDQLELFRT